MNIRKLIREELEKVLNKEKKDKIIQDIHYLKNFSLSKKEKKGDSIIWVYEHKLNSYTVRFYIQKNNSTGKWNARVFVYWKTQTRGLTVGKGKDFDFTYGPFDSYENMVKELNTKLQNNPLISTENYFDDNLSQLVKDTLQLIKLLKERTDDLNKVGDKHFNDLKKIAKEIKNLNTDEELKKYILEKTNGTWEQGFWMTLHKVYQINFYKQKEDIESLF